jgi:hypothetical protein
MSNKNNEYQSIGIYQLHNPKTSLFYQCVSDHFETLEIVWEELYERQYGFWQSWTKAPETFSGRFLSGCHFLLNSLQNILFIRKSEQTFCHNQFVLNPDGQFTHFPFGIKCDGDP